MKNNTGLFTITRRNDKIKVIFKGTKYVFLERENVLKAKTVGCAIMIQEKDKTYSMYLPTYVSGYNNYFCVDSPASKVLDGILNYEYHNGNMLIKMKNYYLCIQPYSYAWYISDVTKERRKHIPKIYAKKAYIRKDVCNRFEDFVIHADNEDLLIKHLNFDVFEGSSQYEVCKMGKIDSLPGHTGCFKVTCNDGQFIYEGVVNAKKYHLVEAFDDEQQKVINDMFKDDIVYGYWFKDENGNILGMRVYKQDYLFNIYSLIFDKPVKTLTLKKRIKFKDGETLDLWKIVNAQDDKKLLVLKKGNDYSYIDPVEFF